MKIKPEIMKNRMMKMWILLLIMLIPLIQALPATPSASDTVEKIDQYLHHCVPYGFSGQVVVEKDSRRILDEAYGYADRQNGTPVSRNTRIGIASMTKQFLAAGILLMAEKKELNLDDPLSKYFSGIPEEKADITLHQLLTHTSGLRRQKNDNFEVADREEMLQDIFNTPLAFEPGSDWRYSVGYSIAAIILEKVSGKQYSEWMHENLFRPAGLKNTCIEQESLQDRQQTANSYVGWINNGNPANWPANFRNFGAGDILSTADDLARWITALETGKILSEASLEKFWTAQSQLENRPVYAYGWFIHQQPGDTVIEHGGDAALGYNGGIFIHLNKNAKIFILSNARTPGGDYLRHAVTENIEDLLEGKDVSLPPAGELLNRNFRDRLAGIYRISNEAENRIDNEAGIRMDSKAGFRIINDGKYLWLAARGQKGVNLLTGADPDQRARHEKANVRTRQLLDNLLRKDSKAFREALGSDGIKHLESYEGDWNRLTNALGPLHFYQLRGSTPFWDNEESLAVLQFRDTRLEVAFIWSDHGNGRLRGMYTFNRLTYPVAIPLALSDEDELIAYDLFDRNPLIFRINNLHSAGDPELRDQESGIILRKKGMIEEYSLSPDR